MDTEERAEYMSQDALMRSSAIDVLDVNDSLEGQSINARPPKEIKGQTSQTDGHEYLEHPPGSATWFYRNHSTGEWMDWK